MCYNGSWVRLPSCEGCTALSSVTFAAEPSCAEGPSIVPGFNCTPACVDGYAPSEGYFYCPVPGSETVVAEREDMLTFPTFGCNKVPECQARMAARTHCMTCADVPFSTTHRPLSPNTLHSPRTPWRTACPLAALKTPTFGRAL